MNGGKPRKAGAHVDELLEQENDRLVDSLSGKVSKLKSIAVDIEHETRGQNRLLDDMGDSFGSGGTLLSSTFNRLKLMTTSGSGNRRMTCYFALGLVILFFFFYILFTHLTKKQ
eukprot:m.7307 g.7307  ORF g.7307 m.7307 type:complete len:114 (+) comp18311_c0_seq2:76-417(+)